MSSDESRTVDEAADAKRKILDRACEEFMWLADTPDAATLEKMVGRYPEIAEELTDFAVEWSVQDLQPGPAAEGVAWEEDAWEEDIWQQAEGSSAVESAMAGLRQRLAAEAADPFAAHPAEELVGIAERLGLDRSLMAKLRHRRLHPETIPDRLCHALAEELRTSVERLHLHFEAAVVPTGLSFKADRRPELSHRETFEQALERSTLTAEDRGRWIDSP